jgi:hypothetical protein
MISGVCKFCGCTNERACRPRLPSSRLGEPCQWIDPDQTLCSACLPCLTDIELQPLWIEEFAPYASSPLPPVQLDSVMAFTAVAALQLALKHPQLEQQCHHGGHFVHWLAAVLADVLSQIGPLTTEALRRGFVGCYQPPTGDLIVLPGE